MKNCRCLGRLLRVRLSIEEQIAYRIQQKLIITDEAVLSKNGQTLFDSATLKNEGLDNPSIFDTLKP